jgi:DNA-binding transcriptional MerR regulator
VGAERVGGRVLLAAAAHPERDGHAYQGEYQARPDGQSHRPIYGEEHERRLRLIRGLITVAGLPVATVREVLDAVTSPDRPVHKILGIAQKSITPAGADLDPPPAERAAAERRVAELIERRGWRARPQDPAAQTLIDTLAVMNALGHDGFPAGLDRYAEASERIGDVDVAALGGDRSAEELAEKVVVGTLLGDTALAALRRLAQQHASARRYGGTPTPTETPTSAPAPPPAPADPGGAEEAAGGGAR